MLYGQGKTRETLIEVKVVRNWQFLDQIFEKIKHVQTLIPYLHLIKVLGTSYMF